MKSLAFKIGEYEVGYDADVFDEFKFKDAKIGTICYRRFNSFWRYHRLWLSTTDVRW
jgi:hypothetical protein